MFAGKLVGDVGGVNRREIIASYRTHIIKVDETESEHPALKEYEFIEPAVEPGSWKLVGDDARKSSINGAKKKRKFNEHDDTAEDAHEPNTKKKRAQHESGSENQDDGSTTRQEPRGLKWDPEDYSCAYDSVFTVLFAVWKQNGPKWSQRFSTVSGLMKELASGFERVANGTESLEGVRDSIRRKLTAMDRNKFPSGRVFTYLGDLTSQLVGQKLWGVEQTKCLRCGRSARELSSFSDLRIITNELNSVHRNSRYGVADWLNADKIRDAPYKCMSCGAGLVILNTATSAPPLMTFELSNPGIVISSKIQLLVEGQTVTYSLRGVIYSGKKHFTCRIVSSDGSIWFNDGIETGRQSLFEGVMSAVSSNFMNTLDRGEVTRAAAVLIYAVDE
ncbi:hypothetical protein R3P38DRAFT_2759269 [Favolaschia claudopus]|uniref:USP domain-containing protein n=1 Tax=Favolaschia claudopus TaxID=2862362 RepID=A0AAW0E7Q4_9AGAR